jgi:hypothetical protein
VRLVRQQEGHGPADVGGGLQDHLALGQSLADKGEFVEFEVAKPPVDQLGGRRGRGPPEVPALDEGDLQAPSVDHPAGGIAGNAGTVHAAADDEQVEDVVSGHGRAALAEGRRRWKWRVCRRPGCQKGEALGRAQVG